MGSPDSYAPHVHAGDVALGLHDPDWSVRRSAVEALGHRDAEAHAGDVAILLRDPDWTVRRAAAASLARLGCDADKQAGCALVDRDPKVRQVAAAALCRRGSEGAADAAKLLSNVDWNVRREAAAVLGQMGTGAIEHVQEIAALLRDVDSSVQCEGIRALVALGVASRYVDPLTALLRDRTAAVRSAAATALGAAAEEEDGVGFPRASCAAVALLLLDTDEHVREAAVAALGRLGAAGAAETVPYLKERDWRIRAAAAEALAGGEDVSEVDAVAEAVHDTKQEVREAAAKALSCMGPRGAHHAAEMLKDSQWEVRNLAVRTLGSMHAGATYANQVAKCLQASNGVVRKSATWALGQMEEKGAAAAAQLLTDQNADTRWAAFEALAAAGPAAAAEAGKVIPALHDQDCQFRRLAAASLGAMGEAAAPHADDVANVLKDGDRRVRQAAVAAFSSFGTEVTAGYVEVLQPLLADQDADVRLSTVMALEVAGEAVQSEVLVPCLRDPHPDVRKCAAKALSSKGDEAIVAFSELLTSTSAIARTSAAMTIGMIGESAQAQIGDLLKLLNDADIGVRIAALGAIGAIGQSVMGGLGEDVVAAVKILCANPEGRLRCAAFEALHKVKSAPQPVVEEESEAVVEPATGGEAPE